MTLGEQIRRARKAKDWTQTDLARAAGCTQPYVRNLEDGTQSPTVEKLTEIARALGVVFTVPNPIVSHETSKEG